MRRSWRGDDGSATAELAVALPAIVLLLGLFLGVLSAGATQIRLQDAAADAARLTSRGEGERAIVFVRRAVTGASVTVRNGNGMVCVHAAVERRLWTFLALPIRVESCAIDGGG